MWIKFLSDFHTFFDNLLGYSNTNIKDIIPIAAPEINGREIVFLIIKLSTIKTLIKEPKHIAAIYPIR